MSQTQVLLSASTPVCTRVQYVPSNTGKAKMVTAIEVYAGSFQLATAKFGGRYSANDALKEFKKNPTRFRLTSRYADAALLGLVPVVVAPQK